MFEPPRLELRNMQPNLPQQTWMEEFLQLFPKERSPFSSNKNTTNENGLGENYNGVVFAFDWMEIWEVKRSQKVGKISLQLKIIWYHLIPKSVWGHHCPWDNLSEKKSSFSLERTFESNFSFIQSNTNLEGKKQCFIHLFFSSTKF